MKNYLKNITLGAALLVLAGGCTDKFEEYNTNQYQIHEADPSTLMKSMIETIVNIQQNDSQMMDQMVGQLGGYLCCSNTWSGTNFGTFNPSDAIKMAKIRIHKLAPLNSTPFRIESTVSISLSLSFFKSRYSPRNDLIANLFRSSVFIVISFL